MTILGKFGAAMTGFWWSLDEHERRLIMLAGLWCGVVVLDLAAAGGKRRARGELVGQVVEELERRGAAR